MTPRVVIDTSDLIGHRLSPNLEAFTELAKLTAAIRVQPAGLEPYEVCLALNDILMTLWSGIIDIDEVAGK